ncbi:MAG: sulfatase-like hydrolase/transferase [Sedimentisphaerales bacterium]|nr:sulfatase-like hydrolase/transferase [Sedimentisphaerales bacterium]
MKNALTRREFLKSTAVLSSAAMWASTRSIGAERRRTGNGKRPNVIFLMSDQQRWDCVGKINPMVKTPALDRIADDGVLFDQAVCQGPMCVPSRYSMMLGLYPSQVGVLKNSMSLTDEQLPGETLGQILRNAGYQTAGFGKTHWRAKGCSTRGFETRFIGQPRTSALYEKDAVMMSDVNPEGLERYMQETRPFGGGEENIVGYLGCTSKVPEEDHRDGWVFHECLDFVENGIDETRPLFLYLSFLKPHAGHNVPPGYEELYDIDEIPVPEQPAKDQVEPCHATGVNREQMYRGFWSKASKKQWQQMILRYWANCSWIDSMFDRVLKKLAAKGILDNCLIVYVSDHGEMLGQRYYRFNKYCLFDSAVRVPMIVGGTAVPRERRGTVDHRPAELVDVLPTILKVAGISNDESRPGRDLLGPVVKEASFCEFHNQPKTAAYMWRTREYKLILCVDKSRIGDGVGRGDIVAGELYDLNEDPQEWNNVFDDAKHAAVREKMCGELIEHLQKYAKPPRRLQSRT